MSEQKTFFGKIFAGIVEIFKSNWESFVKKLWGKVDPEVQEKVSIAIEIVNNIKKTIDSPLAFAITGLIPGNLDDNLRTWLSGVLEQILKHEGLFDKTGEELTRGQLHTVASELTAKINDIPFGQAALTTEVAYQNV